MKLVVFTARIFVFADFHVNSQMTSCKDKIFMV